MDDDCDDDNDNDDDDDDDDDVICRVYAVDRRKLLRLEDQDH